MVTESKPAASFTCCDTSGSNVMKSPETIKDCTSLLILFFRPSDTGLRYQGLLFPCGMPQIHETRLPPPLLTWSQRRDAAGASCPTKTFGGLITRGTQKRAGAAGQDFAPKNDRGRVGRCLLFYTKSITILQRVGLEFRGPDWWNDINQFPVKYSLCMMVVSVNISSSTLYVEKGLTWRYVCAIFQPIKSLGICSLSAPTVPKAGYLWFLRSQVFLLLCEFNGL